MLYIAYSIYLKKQFFFHCIIMIHSFYLYNMKTILILISLFLLSACSQPNEVHYDPPQPTVSTIKNWNQNSFPLVIYIPADMSPYETSILSSEKAWNDALGFEAFRFIFNDNSKLNTQWSKQYDSLYDNYFGVFKIFNPTWNYTDIGSSVLAFTGTLTQNGKIIHADVLFNFQNYSFGDVNDGSSNAINTIDFESVLTHELGHFLGLQHISTSEDAYSVMLPKISRGVAKRVLSNGDVARIKALYNLQ
jgi:hypothetical protein